MMNIPEKLIVQVALEGTAAKFNPIIFKNEDNFCALYGNNPQSGIYGCGKSIEEALLNWEYNLQLMLSNNMDLKKMLSEHEPPESVKQFLNEYRERAKHDSTGYDLNKSF
ncbi:hypothetical protein [Pedobacter agri]|uniref:hypothetical protein n=1 Tax=Pedobacter agri TaxID=454586 RepID=UPI00292F53ED|nr:hypothetical protein [Pedobacter agri]